MARNGLNKRPSGNCVKCATWRSSLHRDHVIPKWQGGPDEDSNTQWLCANCHEDKTFAERKTPEYRVFVSKQMTARMLSPVARAKISISVRAANAKRVWTPEARDKCRGAKGRSRTPEERAAISAALKGRPKSEAHKEALRAAKRRSR